MPAVEEPITLPVMLPERTVSPFNVTLPVTVKLPPNIEPEVFARAPFALAKAACV